jgi:mono/diheme cytochrome c family protein
MSSAPCENRRELERWFWGRLGTLSNHVFWGILTWAILFSGCSPQPEAKLPEPMAKPKVQADAAAATGAPTQENEVIAAIDLAQLKKSGALNGLRQREAKPVSEPFYKTENIVLRGYDLQDVLSLNPLFGSADQSKHSLRFVCVDGYRTTFAFSAIEGATGIIGTGVLTASGLEWPLVARGKTKQHAGPFYLVWDQEAYDKRRPWPYQLTRIELISNAAMTTGIAPPHQAGVDAGYALFKTHCLACHSINLTGGKMGPELNVPRNILSYRDRTQVLAFVKSPQSFRAGSLMPPMALDEVALSAIMDYLDVMANHRICQTAQTCTALASQRP